MNNLQIRLKDTRQIGIIYLLHGTNCPVLNLFFFYNLFNVFFEDVIYLLHYLNIKFKIFLKNIRKKIDDILYYMTACFFFVYKQLTFFCVSFKNKMM